MKAGRLWVVVGVPLILQALIIYHSLNYGVLSGLLQWDDCAFILRAIRNLDLLASVQSPYEMILSIRDISFNAPLADLQSIVGLLATGGQSWGPFVLNVLVVMLAVYIIAFRLTASDNALFAALLIFFLMQPVTINAFIYLKSDWKGGLLFATAVFALNKAAEENDKNLKMIGAGLLGLTTVSKIVAFYLPVFALATLILFEFYGAVAGHIQKPRPGQSGVRLRLDPVFVFLSWVRSDGRTFALCTALAVVPFALFFTLNAKGYIRHIQDALGEYWEDRLTPLERAAYYSPLSPDGAAAWGTLHISFLVFAACCMGIAIWRGDNRYFVSLAIVVLLAVVFFCPLVVATNSTSAYAATFLGVLIGGTLIAIYTIARLLPRWGGVAALIMAIGFALSTELPLTNSAYGTFVSTPTASELRELESTYSQIVDLIGDSAAKKPKVLIFYNHAFAPAPNLSILNFQRRGELINTRKVDSLSDVSLIQQQLAEADFALTIVATGGDTAIGSIRGLSTVEARSLPPGKGDQFVAIQPNFERLKVWPITGGEIRLYRNTALGDH